MNTVRTYALIFAIAISFDLSAMNQKQHNRCFSLKSKPASTPIKITPAKKPEMKVLPLTEENFTSLVSQEIDEYTQKEAFKLKKVITLGKKLTGKNCTKKNLLIFVNAALASEVLTFDECETIYNTKNPVEKVAAYLDLLKNRVNSFKKNALNNYLKMIMQYLVIENTPQNFQPKDFNDLITQYRAYCAKNISSGVTQDLIEREPESIFIKYIIKDFMKSIKDEEQDENDIFI